MATFQITGPDGKKYRVSGENAEGALAALQQHLGSNSAPQPQETTSAPVNSSAYPVDASTVFVDDMLFGLPGKASAALNAAVRAPFTDKTFGEEYDTIRGNYQAGRQRYADEHPVANTAASLGGSIFGAAKLMPAGLNATRFVPQTWSGAQKLAGMTAASAAEGGVMGGLSAYGHDEDIGKGAGIGAVIGGVAYPVTQLGAALGKTVGGVFGIGNRGRANDYLAELVERSGKSATDIADDLARAQADGQSVYTIADALGTPGQKALSGIHRSPGEASRIIAETLDSRQAGQGRRIANALSEGFDAPDTAAQRAARLLAERGNAATLNYGAARTSAGTVDPTRAIAAADDFLGAGGSLPRTGMADDSIESAVARARSYLTDGESVLSDFASSFRAKQELDAMIEGAKPAVQRQLIPIRNALDDALEAASPDYANARNVFRQQSKAIDAVDTGRSAAMRGRVEDTIPTFNALSPDEQAAFRAGYADPLIQQTQGAALGVNKARPLINDAAAAEFPAFAAPGRGPQLADRIGRENTMFETRARALGGSRTADNIADMGDVAGVDPTMIGDLMNRRWGALAMRGLQSGVNAAQGRNQAVRDMIVEKLLSNQPSVATDAIANAVSSSARSEEIRKQIVRALMAGGTGLAIGQSQ